MANKSLGGLASRPSKTGPHSHSQNKILHGSLRRPEVEKACVTDHEYHKQQELRWTLIPDPSGYVGVPLKSSSPLLQDQVHPQRTTIALATEPASGKATSNCPSNEADFRQIKRTTAPGAKQASSKAQPSRQQSRLPAKHNYPNSKAGLRQSITALAASRPPAARSVFGGPIGISSSNKTSLLQINARPPQQRGRFPVSHLRFSLSSETRWVSVLRISPTHNTASLRQHSQATRASPVNTAIEPSPPSTRCKSSSMRLIMRQTASHTYRCTIPAKPRSNAKRIKVTHFQLSAPFLNADPCFYIFYAFLSNLHLLLYGLRPRTYCFHRLRPRIYCFHGLRP
ncbi:hypothetical protein CRG98_014309 [Punica granatum]|uniref:Uncharacterized protein n=1 Tax=Punica granatum TaxID=22663 RepID=A0A2I0K9Q7_PUNGR|nr:hypothetical protein CRG98_014309 [Punica granatum]